MCCDRPPTRLFLLSLAAYASLLSSCAAHAPDNDFKDVRLSRLAFGSCSKPFWPQPLWRAIREQAPQVYASLFVSWHKVTAAQVAMDGGRRVPGRGSARRPEDGLPLSAGERGLSSVPLHGSDR